MTEKTNEWIIKSLGEPDNSIEDHSYEIRPLIVEGKREWWIFHAGVGSGEPLAQWLETYAAQQKEVVKEELRQKLLSMRSTKEAYDKLGAEDKLMQYGYHDCINEMLIWTKSLKL